MRREYEQVWSQLGSRPIEALFDLPMMSDPLALATLDVLTAFMPAALFTDGNLRVLVILKAVNLSLEWGNSDGSCVPYVMFGAIAATRFGDYRGRVAIQQSRQWSWWNGAASRVSRQGHYLNYANVVLPWTRHFRSGRDVLRRAFDAANSSGDVTFAAFSCASLNVNCPCGGRSAEPKPSAKPRTASDSRRRRGSGSSSTSSPRSSG